jgi:ubiquinone biosynthesis protein
MLIAIRRSELWRRASAIQRSLEIIFLVLLHASLFGLRAMPLFVLRRRRRCGPLIGESLARLCEALGATFIKLGQILSSRPDLLPAGVVGPLVRLQDRIAPFYGAHIPSIISAAFGRPMSELYDSFDLVPVASASIAQVHRARLKDGRDVAVKIRRPGISRVVDNDLRILSFISKVLSALPGMSTVPLPELVRDIGNPLREQLDFRLEAANNRLFRQYFARIEHIKMPALVEELCVEDVLTMEHLDKMERVDAEKFTQQERKTAALAGLRALYKMIFTDGFIHADMHPGNVFIREWGEFVILDMGLVARLDEADQRDFVDFFFGLVNNQGRECARIIYESATYRGRNCDRHAFESAMVELIGKHSALKSQEFEVARFAYQLIETQRRFSLRGSTKFMMTILSMVVFDGICKQLYPECDFQNEARGFLITARYRRKPAPKQSQWHPDCSMGMPKSNVQPPVLKVKAS